MKTQKRFWIGLAHNSISLALLFFLSCKSSAHLVSAEYSLISVQVMTHEDKAIHDIIQPYKNTIDSLMNEVIIHSEVDLIKESTEGNLGNFVCDELLEYAKYNFKQPVHFCVLNNGGLRLPSIAKGEIRVGQIYELLPFENTLEILEMDGRSCKKLLDGIAEQGGAPIGGIRFKISGKEAQDIIIEGEPLNLETNYFILTNDYLANGGEERMKKTINRYSMNQKLRDSMILHLRNKSRSAQTIRTVKDGRIVKME